MIYDGGIRVRWDQSSSSQTTSLEGRGRLRGWRWEEDSSDSNESSSSRSYSKSPSSSYQSYYYSSSSPSPYSPSSYSDPSMSSSYSSSCSRRCPSPLWFHLLNFPWICMILAMTASALAGYLSRNPPSPSSRYPTSTIASGAQRYISDSRQNAASLARYTSLLLISSPNSSQSRLNRPYFSGVGNLAKSITARLRAKTPQNRSRQSLRTPIDRYLLTSQATKGDQYWSVGSLLSMKERTLVVSSYSCRRAFAIYCRISRLLTGSRSSYCSMELRDQRSVRPERILRQRSLAFYAAMHQRATLPASPASSRRSSFSLRQSTGSSSSYLGLAVSTSFSAFSTSLQARQSAGVSAKSCAPGGPQLMQRKQSFLLMFDPGSYSWQRSWVILQSRRWQSSSPPPSSLNAFSSNFRLRASSVSTSCTPSPDTSLGNPRNSLISSSSSANSTSTSSSLSSKSFCSSTPSARVIFPAITRSSSQGYRSASLGFSRKRLMRLLRERDSLSRDYTLRRRELLGQAMRSMRARVVWTEAMVGRCPGCSFSESCPHSRTSLSLRTSPTSYRPTSRASSSFRSTTRISASVCLGLSSAIEMSSNASSSCFHAWKREQSSPTIGNLPPPSQYAAILCSFSSNCPVGVIPSSMVLLKCPSTPSQNCLTISRSFSQKSTLRVASLLHQLSARVIEFLQSKRQSMSAVIAWSRREGQREGRWILPPTYRPSDPSSYYYCCISSLEDYRCWPSADLRMLSQKASLSSKCWNSLLQCSDRAWLRLSISISFPRQPSASCSSSGAGSVYFLSNFLLSTATSMLSLSICISGEEEEIRRRLLRMLALMPYLSFALLAVFTLYSSQNRSCCFYLQPRRRARPRRRPSKTDQNTLHLGSGRVRLKTGRRELQSDSRRVPLALGLKMVRMADSSAPTSSWGSFNSQKNSIRCRSGSLVGNAAQLCFHPSETSSIFTSSPRSAATCVCVLAGSRLFRTNSCSFPLISLVPSLRMACSSPSSSPLNRFSTFSVRFHSNLLSLLKFRIISSSSPVAMSSFAFSSRLARQQIASKAVLSCSGLAISASSKNFLRQYRSTQNSLLPMILSICSDSFRQKLSRNRICVLSSELTFSTSAALPTSSGRVAIRAKMLLSTQPRQCSLEGEHSRWYQRLQRSHSIELPVPSPPHAHQRKCQSLLCQAQTQKRRSGGGLRQRERPLRAGYLRPRSCASRLSSCLSSSPIVRNALYPQPFQGWGWATQLRWAKRGHPGMEQGTPAHRSKLHSPHLVPAFTPFFWRLPSTMKARVPQEASLVLLDESAQSTCIHSSFPTFLSSPFCLSPPQTEQASLASLALAMNLHQSHLNLFLPFSSKSGWQQLRCTVAVQVTQVRRSLVSGYCSLRWQTWQGGQRRYLSLRSLAFIGVIYI